MRLVLLALVLSSSALADNVLRGKVPVRGGTPLLTDGEVAFDGAGWLDSTVTQLGPQDEVVWDLGELLTLSGAALQADNNDDYFLDCSEDGVRWGPWWRAGGVGEPGLQTRSIEGVARCRFLKLHAAGGDGRYSVSEVEVFSGARAGSMLLRAKWVPRHPLDVNWAWFVLAVAVVLVLTSKASNWRLVLALGVALAAGLVTDWSETFNAPAIEPGRLNFLRAAVALMAAAAVVRELLWPRRRAAHLWVVRGVLAVAGVLGVLCFLNLGHPQFFDAGKGQPTFLHHYDMRTYYPIAKYFPELRFDGVYAASVMAVAQDRGGLDAMTTVGLRDLRTHEGTTVGAARTHIEAVRARFTQERWERFTADMAYFRNAMGDGGFLGSMNDHGGNATPVWFLAARLLFAWTPASEAALWAGVLLDALLVLLAFVGLWRGFGWRTAFLGMTVFGAMDFYQFGSNWFGAALRHDWLALWCLSLWAMRAKHFRLAGALLAWSALIRAFPAVAFFTLTVPVLWDLGAAARANGFSLRAWFVKHLDYFNLALGAVVATVVLGSVSVVVFGANAWAEWLRKVSLLDRDGHLNNIAVRTYLTTTKGQWLAVVLVAVALLVVVLRRARLEEAAAWGVALVPIIFNPANYYLHAMFILVVLGGETPSGAPTTRGRLMWVALLMMCVASYFSSLTPDLSVHFRFETIIVVVTLITLAVLSLINPPAPPVTGSAPSESLAA